MKERKTIRLHGFDYSSDNLYFVTSCVHNNVQAGSDLSVHCFGKTIHGKMILNEYGKIAEKQWHWLGEQYPYVILHAFVVMPDHIHGIIEINRKSVVRTDRDPSVRNIKIKSLSELMGAYKTTVSKQIHLAGNKEFAWQRSFYDSIIRNEESFENISEYINTNPLNWKEDNLYNQ